MTRNWLRVRREFVGLTQDELAAKLQLAGFTYSRAAVSHWETGRYPIPLADSQFREALAHILKMSVGSLLREAGYETVTEYSEDARQAAEIVDQLSEHERKLALRLLKQFLEAITVEP